MLTIFKDFGKWCDRQEENNNKWFMLPCVFLFFGSVLMWLILIIILFGG